MSINESYKFLIQAPGLDFAFNSLYILHMGQSFHAIIAISFHSVSKNIQGAEPKLINL